MAFLPHAPPSDGPPAPFPETSVEGAFADVLLHVTQLALLLRGLEDDVVRVHVRGVPRLLRVPIVGVGPQEVLRQDGRPGLDPGVEVGRRDEADDTEARDESVREGPVGPLEQ
eukprot:3625537-Lingulodinium_polyedra.AAC.1